jgi:uncharacterized protein (UPF0216 family)
MSLWVTEDTGMIAPSRLPDEGVLTKWMALEMGRINDGVVVERPRLTDLLKSENPSAYTRAGKEHRFDRNMLSLLENKLPVRLQSRLRLPIIFFFDSNVADSCFLTDEGALEVLKTLGEISDMRTMTEGKAWMGRTIVYSLVRKYPSLIQIMMR